jgi:hypothetical protein
VNEVPIQRLDSGRVHSSGNVKRAEAKFESMDVTSSLFQSDYESGLELTKNQILVVAMDWFRFAALLSDLPSQLVLRLTGGHHNLSRHKTTSFFFLGGNNCLAALY